MHRCGDCKSERICKGDRSGFTSVQLIARCSASCLSDYSCEAVSNLLVKRVGLLGSIQVWGQCVANADFAMVDEG